jgi:hypothetical protein
VNTYLTIDVLKPAKQPVLQKSADVALVTDVFNPEKCGQYYVYENRSVFDTTCRVRLQSEIFMEGMEDVIAESQFFTGVANIGMLEKNMLLTDMLSLSQDANPDILLILDDFQMKDETYFVPSTYGGYGVMRGIFISSLVFYDAASQSLLRQKTLLDTVYWVSKEMSRYEFVNLERDRESILKYLAHEAGKKVAAYFFPAWVNVTRVLIVPQGKESQRASEAALAGSWERANYFWEALSKEKNKKKQSAAWFNRAVYQEINGDFETAMDFVKRADALRSRRIHHVYLEVLEQRVDMQQQFESMMNK